MIEAWDELEDSIREMREELRQLQELLSPDLLNWFAVLGTETKQ